MTENTATNQNHHCTVLEQRHLVSEMTKCDKTAHGRDTYECYLKATQKSRESNACMFA